MGLFSRGRAGSPPEPPAPALELSLLQQRLAETAQQPLKRIVTADLSGEAREIADALNARLDAVASSEKEQQQFIADVSHELRTPLTVMRGSLEVALEEDRPAEEYREAIGNALLEVRHLTRLSQNLLFLARGHAGRVTLSFANTDLGKFISEVTRDLLPAVADKGLELLVDLPEESARTFIDADRMQQVIHNLLENAIRYTNPGGRIHVRLSSTPSEARIEISDTGIGIPEQHLPFVFERFFRTDRARRAHPGGSGLGLSIVRWIVEAHKGKVEVSSRVGEGTTFTITLPLVT
ncbi:MAG TPA: HAMP domain-containing sensor histidine kinase [Thermoanaerobaculia bacterium]|jgi:signal transduction histidine kinase